MRSRTSIRFFPFDEYATNKTKKKMKWKKSERKTKDAKKWHRKIDDRYDVSTDGNNLDKYFATKNEIWWRWALTEIKPTNDPNGRIKKANKNEKWKKQKNEKKIYEMKNEIEKKKKNKERTKSTKISSD